MMELHKDIEDRHSYPLCPQEHRWIYNKLTVAEMFGHYCGPSGTRITKPGFYCLRPMMNCAGLGIGGFLKFEAKATQKGITQPEHKPGYFWTEWFDGWHAFTNYTDDKPIYECGGHFYNGEIIMRHNAPFSLALPEQLKGISKYMLIEHIGGKIIEVSPRHDSMPNNPIAGLLNGARVVPTKYVQYPNPDDDFGYCWRIEVIK